MRARPHGLSGQQILGGEAYARKLTVHVRGMPDRGDDCCRRAGRRAAEPQSGQRTGRQPAMLQALGGHFPVWGVPKLSVSARAA